MTAAVTKPTVLHDLDEELYHADTLVPHGSLSFSGAKKLLPPYCPAIYQWERTHRVTSDAFDFGHAAHKLILGVGADIVPVEAESWRTKAAQAERDAIRADGKTPLLADDYARAQAVHAAVEAHPVASLLLTGGEPEVSMFWQDDDSGVWCRGRIDYLTKSRMHRRIAVDVKTSVSANPEKFGKSAVDFGYAMQAAWYIDGVKATGLDDDPSFLFVVVEKTPPHLVSVVELDVEALRVGRELNRRARAIYAECAATDTWPSYTPDDITLVSLPRWAERQLLGETA